MSAFGLYLHIPYCVQKCPYCDFNSYGVGVLTDDPRELRYVDALIAEMQLYSRQPEWSGRGMHTMFFGGGTPSLLSENSIDRILRAASGLFPFADDIEITLEANPGTVQEEFGFEKLRGFRNAGINRLSFGSQSFSERKLRFLGRLHSPTDIVSAVRNARRAGFTNLNLDLIYGTAGESDAEWASDLGQALGLRPEHISAYTLTVERGTPFDRRSRDGDRLVGDEDRVSELYLTTQSTLSDAGYAQYEVSNYARLGQVCRHNEHYWLRSDYLGIGAGAHSFCDTDPHPKSHFGSRRWNVPSPEDYISRMQGRTGESARLGAVSHSELLTREQALLEFFFQRVRIANGFNLSELSERFELSVEEIEARFGRTLQELERSAMVTRSESGQICISPARMVFADSVVGALCTHI